MSKRDFDKFIAERRKKKPNGFTMFGTEYHLPPTVPYQAVLEFSALAQEDKDKEVGNDKILVLLAALIGADNVKALSSNVEFDMDIAVELLNYVLEAYGLKETKEKNLKAVPDQIAVV